MEVIDWHHHNKSTVSRTAKEYGIDRKQVRNWLESETYLRLNTVGESAEKKRLGAGPKAFSEELDMKVFVFVGGGADFNTYEHSYSA